MELDKASLEQALGTLGDVLESRGYTYELVVIGGSALMMLELGVRPTKDLDILALVEDGQYINPTPLPVPLAQAAHDVGATLGLPDDWLNVGPASLLDLGLPVGFQERTTTIAYGGVVLRVAGRVDQIYFKLYAAADLGPDSKHTADLERLEPSDEELLAAARWTLTLDPSPGFRRLLMNALAHFGVSDADSRL